MTDKRDDDQISVEEIVRQAVPLATTLLGVCQQVGGNMLSTVAALEAAKVATLALGEERFGPEFRKEAQRILDGFAGFEEIAAALANQDGTFTQSGGSA